MATNRVGQYESSFLKGLAILAVIGIHTLSSLGDSYSLTNPWWSVNVFVDQLMRFSVPLFVALSGYGFWQKYQGKSLSFREFIGRQSAKLIPLYFLASLILYLTFFFVPTWRDPLVTQSFVIQFLTGRVDYHLYFVPMIFQLYLLFPFFRFVVIKYRWISLVLVGFLQVAVYYYLTGGDALGSLQSHFASDQQIYFWFFTWVFYFILGMHMGDIVSWTLARSTRLILLFTATLISFLGVSYSAVVQIYSGVDPIVATAFTRIELLFYATCVVIALFVVAPLCTRLGGLRVNILSKVGDYSYPLYLFHTLVLRVLLAIVEYRT